MMRRIVRSGVAVFVVPALLILGCAKEDKVLLEIDFSNVSEWKYLLGANISGESGAQDVTKNFSGSLRTYLQGHSEQKGDGVARFGLRDVTLIAPFFPQEERDDIEKRLAELEVSVSESGISLNDTIGIPGVMTGGWDIIRCITRVMPVMPNSYMSVGASWEREQRFPFEVDSGTADGLLYQLFTLDSVYKDDAGVSFAAFSWVFTYRVSTQGDGAGVRKYPLSGSGRGTAALNLDRKMLTKSQAMFQITHSQKGDTELNEIVHFEVVE